MAHKSRHIERVCYDCITYLILNKDKSQFISREISQKDITATQKM